VKDSTAAPGARADSPMNVRAPSYAIVNASALCPDCGKFTHVIALCLPPHHEVLNVSGSSDDVAAAPDQAIFADE